jgi:hypothetical protein
MLEKALRMQKGEPFGGEVKEKITTLLSKIEKLKNVFRWTDRVAVIYAGLNMSGKATDWFNSISGASKSWKEFKDACAKRFTIRVSSYLVPHVMGKFEPKIKQHTGESSEDFLARVREELQYINSEEPLWLVLCFLSGMRPEMHEQMRFAIGDEAPSIDELLANAIRIETALKSSTFRVPPAEHKQAHHQKNTHSHTPGSQGKQADTCRVCNKSFEGPWKLHAQKNGCIRKTVYTPPPSGASIPSPAAVNKPVQTQGISSSGMTCWNCNERGHTRNMCPKPQTQNNTQKKFVRQVKFQGESSSTRSDSESDDDDNNQPVPTTPLPTHTNHLFDPFTGQRLRAVRAANLSGSVQAFEQAAGVFSVKARVAGGEEINCTIDSGADSVSILHQSMYEKMPIEYKKLVPTGTQILNADGKAMDVLGEVVVPFTFKNVKSKIFDVSVRVFVCTQTDVGCILGTDFLLGHTNKWEYGKDSVSGMLGFVNKGSVHMRVATQNSRPTNHSQVMHTPLASSTIHVVKSTAAVAKGQNGVVGVGEMIRKVQGEASTRSQAHVLEEQEKEKSKDVREDICIAIKQHVDTTNIHDALSQNSKNALYEVLCENAHVFDDRYIGTARLQDGKPAVHRIYTHSDRHPVKQKPYSHPKSVNEYIDTQIEEWLREGTVVEGSSEWSSPVVVVKKKADPVTGERGNRCCIDYRKLNSQTVKDVFPIPNIDILLRKFGKSKFFTIMDHKSAYHQIIVALEHRHKTAFIHGGRLYVFVRMPFGLCNAPASFQRFIMDCLLGVSNVEKYLDDVIVHSETEAEHVLHVKAVMDRLSLCGIKLKLTKCVFGQSQVKFLGHVVGTDGVSVDPAKVEVVRNMLRPTNVKLVQVFLGLVNYYSKFIENFAKITRPLHKLTRKDVEFVWSEECEQAFSILKEKLSTAPILIMPNFNKRFSIHTDASKERIGAVLTQWDDEAGQDRVVMYASRATKPAEQNYPTTQQELLAIIFALQKFRPYVYGQEFEVLTDHQPLVNIRNVPELSGRLGRWLLYMEQYTAHGNMKIIYKAGKANTDADAMSRLQFHEAVVRGMTRAGRQEIIAARKQEMEEEEDMLDIAANPMPDVFADVKVVEVSDLQSRDPVWTHMYEYVKNGKFPPNFESDQKIELRMESLQYFIENGVLFHIHLINNKYQNESAVRQLCLPISMREKILYELHNMHGHQSVDKTFVKLLSRYYWPSMYVDTCAYCATCEVCLKRKTPHHQSQLPMLSPQRDMYEKYDVNDALVIDYVGPMPMSSSKKIGMVTMVDVFSRRAKAVPVSANTTKNVIDALGQWFDQFGVPRIIISDNGSGFTSGTLKHLCEAIGVERRCVLPYAPWANGVNERFNGTIVNMVAMNIAEHKETHSAWDKYLNQAVFAYNTSIHPATGYTPFFLSHGREAKIGSESVLRGTVAGQTGRSHAAYVAEMLERMAVAHANVKDRVHKKAEQRDALNALLPPPVFAVGDVVYIYKHVKSDKGAGISKKLSSPWEGPYEIVESYNDVSYRVRHKTTGKYEKSHGSWMKKAVKKPVNFASTPTDEKEIKNEATQSAVTTVAPILPVAAGSDLDLEEGEVRAGVPGVVHRMSVRAMRAVIISDTHPKVNNCQSKHIKGSKMKPIDLTCDDNEKLTKDLYEAVWVIKPGQVVPDSVNLRQSKLSEWFKFVKLDRVGNPKDVA